MREATVTWLVGAGVGGVTSCARAGPALNLFRHLLARGPPRPQLLSNRQPPRPNQAPPTSRTHQSASSRGLSPSKGPPLPALLPGGAPGGGDGSLGAPQPWGPGAERAYCADLGDHAGALPARYRTAAVGRAGGATPAPYLPAPRAGFPAALPGRVAHGPGLCECPAPAAGGGQGGADSHGSSSHPPSALQILPGAAAPAGPPLPRVPSLRPPLRPPLPLDGELRGGAQPPALRGLPGAAAGGASVGPVPGMVRPPFLPALGALAAVQRAAVGHLPAALPLLFGGGPAPRLAPLPGGQQHHHLGVHLLAPHRLPPPAPRQPLRPRPDPQPGPLLLRMALRVLGDPVGRGGGGGGGGQQPGGVGLLEARPPSCA